MATFSSNKAVAGAVFAGAGIGAIGAARLLSDQRRRVHIQRTLRVWRLTARRSAHWTVVKVRGRALDEQRRAELEKDFVIRSAEDVAQVLGGMKGAIMKAGQMFSFIADGLPPEAAAALATLQADVAPMSPSLAEQVITEEFGRRPSELFLYWDPVPVAAASIGQVHRAVLRNGTEVAVKVQYPGVDTAISSDLDNAHLLYALFSQFAMPSLDVNALLDEVRARMSEELDYRIEARSQMAFAEYYAGHPFIRIPGVIPECSSRRVLTSEWVDGMPWRQFLDSASAAVKQAAAEAMARFMHGSVYYRGMFNGDPHPGNYRFHADGTVTFLDFGLVKHWSRVDIVDLSPLLDAVLSGNASALVANMERLGCLPDGQALDAEKVLEYVSTPYIPFIEPNFRYTHEWIAEALRKIVDIEGNYRDILDLLDLPTSYVILDRVVWGMGAMLGHLQAQADWGRLLDEYRNDAQPSTELGELERAWRNERHPGSRSLFV